MPASGSTAVRVQSGVDPAATKDDTSVSVVVPVYNSQPSLRELVDRLHAVLSKTVTSYEVILVNDGSRDNSWSEVERLASENSRVHGISLTRNYGQHNAVLAGVRAASCGLVVTIDDDLQHPPEEIPRLLNKLADGYDVVYGVPTTMHHGLYRNMSSQLTKAILKGSMGVRNAPDVSAFRAFRTSLRGAFDKFSGPYVSIDVLLTWATTAFTSIEVMHHPRTHGASNYTLRKLAAHGLNMATGFSVMPLRLASLVGFGFTLLGLAVLVYVVGRTIVQGSVPGFPFLASTIAVFSGAQLFALGIIGEYLARIHNRTMDRPTYMVGRVTDDGLPSSNG